MVVQIYIPNNVQVFSFHQILTNIYIFYLFGNSHSKKHEMVSLSGLDLHYLKITDAENPLIYLLVIFKLYFRIKHETFIFSIIYNCQI